MKFQSIAAGFFSGIFTPAGWPAFVRKLRGRSGVYVIREANTRRTLYVGESHTGRLYQTLTRHFQSWSGKTAGATYSRGSVEVGTIITTPARAVTRQNELICRLKPRDNTESPACELPDNPF